MTPVEDLWLAERDALVSRIRWQHGLNLADAEDVVSEAFTRMLDEGRADAPALHRKAQSLAVDLWRRAYRDDERLAWDDLTRASGLDEAERRADLTRAIRGLPERERQAFCLTELRGLTEREAAAQLGVAQKTVNRLAASARAILREELEDTP